MDKFLLIIMLFSSACGPEARKVSEHITTAAQDSTKEEARQLYTTYCAGCHGADLAGGSATSLIKDEWVYGRTRGLMIRNIKFGITGTEMGSFEQILADHQTEAVVDYIREAQDVPPSQEVVIPAVLETEDYQIRVEQLCREGLEVPWAIEFIDQNKALISERKGQLRWLIDGVLDPSPIEGLPTPHTGTSTGGYMDIALDPNYHQTGWVYLAYSHSRDNYKDRKTPATTRIIRGKIQNHQWVAEESLFMAPDSLWVTNGNRWGCRLLFDSQGKLFFSIGDMGRAMDSQEPGKVSGKIYRINPDGSLPSDNPFLNKTGALGAVYSLGNRNVQGLKINPETGKIWFSEHGPMGGDELNILKKGANYGWPVITYGLGYSGEVVSEKTHQEGMEQPVHQWTPSIGVCAIEFVESSQFPEWQSNLLIGALAFEELRRYEIEGDQMVHSEMLLKGMGRVRDIKTAPDGSIYVVLNTPDLLLRLTVSTI